MVSPEPEGSYGIGNGAVNETYNERCMAARKIPVPLCSLHYEDDHKIHGQSNTHDSIVVVFILHGYLH